MTAQKKSNQFLVRVANIDTLKSIERLYETKKFDSKNQMLNEIIERGLASLLSEYGKHRTFDKPLDVTEQATAETLVDIKKILKQQQLNMDDIFVMLNVMESLCSILLNIKLSQLNDEHIDNEMIEAGYLSSLPDFLQQVKNEVTSRLYKRN